MKSTQSQAEKHLSDALAKLEACLETPVIPGELPGWTDTARKALAEVGPSLRARIDRQHRDHFAQIESDDPGLLRRVEEMKQEDEQLARAFERLDAQFTDLTKRAAQAEPNEVKLDEAVQKAVQAGLSFVVRVRTQERALTTWLLESLNRDRGIAD